MILSATNQLHQLLGVKEESKYFVVHDVTIGYQTHFPALSMRLHLLVAHWVRI